MNDKGIGRIFFDLGRATAQFAIYSLGKNERDRYRSKGRIYHYLGMLSRPSSRTGTARDAVALWWPILP